MAETYILCRLKASARLQSLYRVNLIGSFCRSAEVSPYPGDVRNLEMLLKKSMCKRGENSG
ncbi:hypothetical protein KBY25_20510 [Ruegeria pomeroyi]|nr:hypothetical protein [Ruegeria pomeroyi]